MKLTYMNIKDVLNIYDKTIENSGGGAKGTLDLGRIESILEHIQNDDYYPYFEDKITHLFFSICKFHCFQDGNKRLAITLSAKFLIDNGYFSIAKTFFIEMENISYHVAAGKINKDLLHKIMCSILKNNFNSNEELKLDIIRCTQN